MAKITLPTNYVDDIMNTSVEGKRKYRMFYNDDNTVSFEDVTPYDQVGTDFGAGDINATNQAVNESFDKNKLIRDMDAINALTKEGYAPDALALKEVNQSLPLYKQIEITIITTIQAGTEYVCDWINANQETYTGVNPEKVIAIIPISCQISDNGSVIGKINMVGSIPISNSNDSNVSYFNAGGTINGTYLCRFLIVYHN